MIVLRDVGRNECVSSIVVPESSLVVMQDA